MKMQMTAAIQIDVENINAVIKLACQTTPDIGEQLSMVAGALTAMCQRYEVSEANCHRAIELLFERKAQFLDDKDDVAGHA